MYHREMKVKTKSAKTLGKMPWGGVRQHFACGGDVAAAFWRLARTGNADPRLRIRLLIGRGNRGEKASGGGVGKRRQPSQRDQPQPPGTGWAVVTKRMGRKSLPSPIELSGRA